MIIDSCGDLLVLVLLARLSTNKHLAVICNLSLAQESENSEVSAHFSAHTPQLTNSKTDPRCTVKDFQCIAIAE